MINRSLFPALLSAVLLAGTAQAMTWQETLAPTAERTQQRQAYLSALAALDAGERATFERLRDELTDFVQQLMPLFCSS